MNSKLGSVRDLTALQNDDGSGPDANQSFGALVSAPGNARVSIDDSAGIKRYDIFTSYVIMFRLNARRVRNVDVLATGKAQGWS